MNFHIAFCSFFVNNKERGGFTGKLLHMALSDIFFPKFCLNCGHLGSYICLACEKKLSLSIHTCIYCGKGSYLGITHAGCRKKDGVTSFFSVFFYNPTLKKILKEIKYRFVKEACAELLYGIKPESIDIFSFFRKKYKDIELQPVPLHEKRLRMRGFNQAQIIAAYLQRFMPWKSADALERIVEKVPQAQIDKKEQRLENMKGAFGLKKNAGVSGRHILLVDDVVTTGATVLEACRILKGNGAKTVHVFSLAKG